MAISIDIDALAHKRILANLVELEALGSVGYEFHIPLGFGKSTVEWWARCEGADADGNDARVLLQARPVWHDAITFVTPTANQTLKTLQGNSAAINGGTITGTIHTSGGSTPYDFCEQGIFTQYANGWIISPAIVIRLRADTGVDVWEAGDAIVDFYINRLRD